MVGTAEVVTGGIASTAAPGPVGMPASAPAIGTAARTVPARGCGVRKPPSARKALILTPCSVVTCRVLWRSVPPCHLPYPLAHRSAGRGGLPVTGAAHNQDDA